METLRGHGFEESPTIPGILKNLSRGIIVAVHVDDLLCTGLEEQLEWLSQCLQKSYELKTQFLGPGHDHEVSYLNRTLSWNENGKNGARVRNRFENCLKM